MSLKRHREYESIYASIQSFDIESFDAESLELNECGGRGNNNKRRRDFPPSEGPPHGPPNLITIFTLDDLLNNENNGFLGPDNSDNLNSNNLNLDKEKTNDTNSFCQNPLCNHKTEEDDSTKPEIPDIRSIESLDDLIAMGKSFHCKKNLMYRGINLRLLCNIVPALTEFNNMVGMKDVKNQMVDQILFFLQGFNNNEKCGKCCDCAYNLPCPLSREDMLHTVITGPPGVGKTCLGRILGKVYKGMGILENGDFHEIKRSDLVAKYLGQTSHRTQDVIDKCKGGVMFIDEAYSLGNPEGRDSYSKECIDTLTRNLSEKRDFLCIIAGYKDSLERCFFSMNEGLKRRFTFTYNVKGYTYDELHEIFERKVYGIGWKLDYKESESKDGKKSTISLFKEHRESLPNFGGDIETLFLQCKIAHSRRMPVDDKFILNQEDIKTGFEYLTRNRKYKKSEPPFGLYL